MSKLSISMVAAIVLAMLPSASGNAGIMWGVNGHPLVAYPISVDAQLDYVRELGMTSYRFDIGGTDKLPDMLQLVRAAKERGITPLPVVTPPVDFDKQTPEDLRSKAYGLAFALVSSFKGQIPVWELGNELENYAIIKACETQDDGKQYNCAWGPAGGNSTLDYFGPRWAKVSAVLKGLTEGARAADPAVKVAIGTAGWGHIGAFERMKADGIEWDISVWHMYGEDPEWALKKLRQYKHPIWITEFNNSRGSEKSKELQVQGLMQQMTRLTELQQAYGVEAAHIYELLDEPYWGKEDFEAVMGLVELKKDSNGLWVPGDRKPAFDAVKKRLAGAVASAHTPHEISVERKCELNPEAANNGAVDAKAAVAYSFCLVLGRQPDGSGLVGYASRLAGGLPISQALTDMLNSEEFATKHDVSKLSTDEYVRLIHRVLFGAEPSPAALKEGAGALDDQKTRIDFQRGLIDSAAFRQQHAALFGKPMTVAAAAVTPPAPALAAAPAPAAAPAKAIASAPQVARDCDVGILHKPLEFERGQNIYSYCLVLGRWPDVGGLAVSTDRRRSGMTLETFLNGLLQSAEFNAKYKTDTLDEPGFVTLLYRVLLSRDPNADELGTAAGRLASGEIGRLQVSDEILASAEFHKKQEALFAARMPEKTRAEIDQ